jgi:hypothetical protein
LKVNSSVCLMESWAIHSIMPLTDGSPMALAVEIVLIFKCTYIEMISVNWSRQLPDSKPHDSKQEWSSQW